MSKKKFSGKKHSKNNIPSATEVRDNTAEAKEAQSAVPAENTSEAKEAQSAEPADNAAEAKEAQSAEPADNTAEAKEAQSAEPADNAAEAKEAQSAESADNAAEAKEAQSAEPADNTAEAKEASAESADSKLSESSGTVSAKKKKHKSSDNHKSSQEKSQSSKETGKSSSEKKHSLAIPLFIIIFVGLAFILFYNQFNKNGQEPAAETSPVASASVEESPSPEPEQTAEPSPEPSSSAQPGAVQVKPKEHSSILLKSVTPASGSGKYIKFGSYPQNKGDKPEPIEWIVLAKDNEAQLLVSRYGLDCMPFNSEFMDVSWNDCELRKWLNNDFYNTAFSFSEKNKIVETKLDITVKGDVQQQSEDKIFCLSTIEAMKLFESDEKRACEPTDFAISHNAYKDPETGFCLFWLRSPGLSANGASIVLSDGKVWSDGYAVHEADLAVRPALRRRL